MKSRQYRAILERCIKIRAWLIRQWVRIPEPTRNSMPESISTVLNYLTNALLLAVPFSVLCKYSYWKLVLCIWILMPFVEHYYAFFREGWRDDTPPK